jgi:HSP20 family molecular chaperone IbpA
LTDEGDILVIIAEIPGADVNKTEIQVKGDKLYISALGPHHNYMKRVKLPNTSKGQILGWSFRNGILEVTVSKKRLKSPLMVPTAKT